MKLAARMASIAPSATLALNAEAQALRAQGRDVVSLTAGEPDFPCPGHIVEALVQAARDGATRYTPVAGIPQARSAVAERYRPLLSVETDNVILTAGGKQALFNAMQCLLDPGDEVITPAPYWLSYRDMTMIAEGRFVPIETNESTDFLMSASDLEAKISSRTKLVVLNSPSNPTGALYGREELASLLDVIRAHPQVVLVFDEIYDQIVYPPATFVSPLDLAPDLADRMVVINGGSKTYAMTGLRIGWALAPKDLIKAMSKIQGQSTSNPSAPVQHALVAALQGDQSVVEVMRAAFEVRRDRVGELLAATDGVHCFTPRGAFYAFPNVAAHLGKTSSSGAVIHSAAELCTHLLEACDLVVVPGNPFGAPTNVRLSFATEPEIIERGLERFAAGLAELT